MFIRVVAYVGKLLPLHSHVSGIKMSGNWLTILQIANKIPDVSQLRIRDASSYFSIYINGCQQYPGCVPTVPTTRANISFCPSLDFTIKSIGSVGSCQPGSQDCQQNIRNLARSFACRLVAAYI